jgi:drug/metabolite transporter (DMT)-like permease
MKRLSARELLVYLFLCAVWGSTWLAIRVGVRDLPPLLFAGLRMALACLVMTPMALTAGKQGRREKLLIAWNGFLQIGLAYALIFLAARRIESGLSALIFSTFPIWVGFLAHFFLPGEPWTPPTVAAALLGVAGVAIIEAPAVGRALAGGAGPLVVGGGLVLAAALTSAISNVSVKKHLSEVSPAANVWGQTLVGAVCLLAASWAFERGEPVRWTPSALACVGYLALFGTAIAFAGLFWLIPRVSVSLIGSIPVVDTLIAVLLGAIFLHEKLPTRIWAGGAAILMGAFLAATAARTPKETVLSPKS